MSGDIFKAIEKVIQELITGKKSNNDILYTWDSLRGSDNFANYIRKDKIISLLDESNNFNNTTKHTDETR